MDDVAIIDADAHVEEDVETWDFLDQEFRDRQSLTKSEGASDPKSR